MKFNQKHKLNKSRDAFISHFRLLGLPKGECRTNVIRSAAQAMSVALSFHGDRNAHDHSQQSAEDVRRARIAVAAYRLLDPRERNDLYERVQLCYPIDRDSDEPTIPVQGKLLDQMPRIPTKVRMQATKHVKLMEQPVIGEAIEGNSPTDEEPGASRQTASSVGNHTELSLEERRGIVRLLREAQDATAQGRTALSWIRSKLGI